MKSQLTDTPSQKNRPTIGLLTRKLSYSWALSQVQGMFEACRERNVNLVCFPGGHLLNLEELDTQANIAYDLAVGGEFDGFIILSSAIVAGLGQNELEDFYKRFYPTPIVNIELSPPGIPVVFKSEYEAMREILHHLTEDHGYRRIAHISREGSSNPGHLARYQAYLDTLAEYDLPFDPNLVFHSKNLSELDERKLRPGIDFEVLAANEDEYALAALQVLQARGIRVPEEVAIIGFDDLAESWAVMPPLTTVSPPFHEMGYKAVEMLLDLLAGEAVPEQVTLPSKLVIRQSCGCMTTAEVAGAGSEVSTVRLDPGAAQANRETLDAVLAVRRGDIVAEIALAVSPKKPNPDRVGQLLDGFVAEVKDRSPGLFLRELNEILRQVEAAGDEVRLWQNGLSVLRHRLRPCLDDEAFALADNLWQQGRVLIGEVAERAQAYQAVQAEQRAQVLREVSQDLITTFDVEGLMDILAESLPRLNFPSCYLALYETPQPYQYPQPDLGWSRLVLAYDERGRVELEAGGRRFPSCQLLPAGMWPDRQFSFLFEPLYFRDNQLGFALFEMGPRTGALYDALRGQISSALQGALLVQQEEKRARQLQTVAEVSTATSTILDTAELLRQVVDLTKERFGLYHVHIYLLNEDGDILELTAGAGEVGRKMVAQNWHIALNAEQPLVARAARTRQGEIVNNTRSDPSWLPNPLLPDTQSELAVPLIAGDIVLGVLDVQADEVNYFTEDDVRIQSTLAGQIAAALQNATLFEQVAQANTEIQALNKKLQTENLRMSAELDVARRLQEMILPPAEELKLIEGLDIVGFMQPADEVGGDYYDVLQKNGITHIGIGDVTGHGLESGVLMLMTQTAIRTLIDHGETDPVKFVTTLNRTIYNNVRRTKMDKSLTFALVNFKNGQLKIVGQHEEILVVKANGQVERMDTLDLGLPLGIEEEIAQWVDQAIVELAPGEGIVLYTDGITEAANDKNELYGLERLCEVVNQNWHISSAEEVKQAVVEDVTRHIGQQIVYDDLTMVVLKQ